MVEGIRQQTNEDDEAFLLRAETVMEMEQQQIRDRARHLLATALKLCDKPDSVPGQEGTLHRMAGGPNSYIARRALLVARSMCRELQDASTGPDPVAREAYQVLSQLAREALRV